MGWYRTVPCKGPCMSIQGSHRLSAGRSAVAPGTNSDNLTLSQFEEVHINIDFSFVFSVLSRLVLCCYLTWKTLNTGANVSINWPRYHRIHFRKRRSFISGIEFRCNIPATDSTQALSHFPRCKNFKPGLMLCPLNAPGSQKAVVANFPTSSISKIVIA